MSIIAPSSQSKPRALIPPWLTGPWGTVGIALIGYLLVFLAWTYFHWGGEERATLIGDLAILPPILLAMITALRVAMQGQLSPRVRRAWLLLGISFLALLLGEISWAYLENVLQVEPFPSIADVFYLGFYPFMLWGLLMLPGAPQNRRERFTFLLDLIIVLTTASMFVGYFLIVPTAAVNNSDLLSQILATAYPILSLMLLGGVIALLLRPPESDTHSMLFLLLIGICFFLTSDLTFGYASLAGTYVVGSWIDVGWNIAQLFAVLAALRQVHSEAIPTTKPSGLRLLETLAKVLPLLAVISSYGLVFYVTIVNFSSAAEWVLVGAVLLTLFLIARQILAPSFINLSVRAKLILTFLLVCVFSVGLVTLFTYLNLRSNLESAVGTNLKAQTEIQAQTVGNLVGKQIDILEGFVLNEALEVQANTANAEYAGDPAIIRAQLQRQNLDWKIAGDNDALVQTVLKSDTTHELREFLQNFPAFTDALLTDKYGATIGATTRPVDYLQENQVWWQAAYHDGQGAIYMGQPMFNPVTRTTTMIIAMPVRSALGSELVGVIRILYNVQDIFDLLGNPHAGVTSDLLLPSGHLLISSGDIMLLDPDTVARLHATDNINYVQMSLQGTLQLVSQAPVKAPDPEERSAYENLNWILIDHQNPAIALAPVNAARRTAMLTIIFALVLTTGIAMFLAQIFVAPISRLTVVAKQIAAGDLAAKAQVESQDEIGTLASTFNSMLDALSRTQQELQESEALYRSLVDYSPDMILVHRDGKVLFVNPAGVKLLGVKSANEIVNQPVLNIISPEDREFVRQRMKNTRATREPTPLIQQKMHRLDGTSFEAEFKAIPLVHASQPIVQFVMRDITVRKRSEEQIRQLLAKVEHQKDDLELRVAERTKELNTLNQRLRNELTERQQLMLSLRDSEERFRLLFEASPDAIFLIDPYDPNTAWPIIDCNEVACTMNGYTRGQLIGQSIDILNASPGYLAERGDYLKLVRQKGIHQYEALHRHSAGHLFPVEVSTSIITFAGRELVLGIDRNITERKRSEEALRLSEEKYRSIFENVQDVFYTTDYEGYIVTISPSVEKHSGYRPEEVIGKHVRTFFMNAEDYQKLDFTVSTQGMLNDYEMVMKRKDGSSIYVSVTARVVFDENGQPVSTEGVMRDITERKQAEEALSQAKDAAEASQRVAEAANRAKSEFLSRMSHELRTPMNAILGFAQLLELSNKEPLSSTQKERVRQIEKGGQHLLDLINEILDISRIEANRMQISPEPVAVRESIEEVLDLTAPLAVKRHIQIVTKLGGMQVSPFVMADRQRLKQVLLNLLGNAVKYNYDGGSVIVTCEQTPLEKWRISIADTGPGISQENLTRLFMPFERVGADQTSVEGTGLGLVLAKRLIELMHGQVGVESIVGRGSTFWVELPSAESPVERLRRTGVTKELKAMSPTARKILYVEDNVANFELIQQVLADYSHFELLWAADAKTGLETVRQCQPNLILLDLHLGGMDGAEVLKQLKQDEETTGIPVIVVSADATSGQVERLTSLGAQAYLTKPLNVKHFVRLVEELLGEKVM